MRSALLFIGIPIALAIAYLLAWPVPIQPVAWTPTIDPGYVGDFAANTKLANAQYIELPDGEYGPEDLAVGPDGHLYTAVHSGKILRLNVASKSFSVVAETGGRPLGIEFGPDGSLWIADAYLGLLVMSADGSIEVIASQTDDGSPILYADDVDIAPDGKVYFSDASTRFGAKAIGGTLEASLIDLMEHSSNGRVLVYDPSAGTTTIFAEGLTFANGVAVTASGDALLVNETGTYAVHSYSLLADNKGEKSTVRSGLPGFPDNINRMPDGSFWLGIVSPRSAAMDSLAQSPFMRKVVMRLPASARPGPQRYSFVVRVDEQGEVTGNLQDPTGFYASTTGATVLPDGRLAISSLTEPRIAIVDL